MRYYGEEKRFENESPFEPWNKEMYKDDPFKPWNKEMYRDDPFAPWNSPFGRTTEKTKRRYRY